MQKNLLSPRLSSQEGLTLIELMVVVALVGILSGIAIPSYLKWRSDAGFRRTSGQLIGNLQLAKGRAIRINARVVVQFAEGGYTVFEDNGASPGDGIQQDDERTIASVSFPSEIKIDLVATTFSNDRVQYNGRGVPVMAVLSRQLVLKGKSDKQTTFTVNRLGRIVTS